MSLNNIFDVYVPYCLERCGDNRWKIVNREYKPLGQFDIELREDQHVFEIKIPNKTLRKFIREYQPMDRAFFKNEDHYYWFHDGGNLALLSKKQQQKQIAKAMKLFSEIMCLDVKYIPQTIQGNNVVKLHKA